MDNRDFIDKKSLSERDICTKFITPAIKDVAGWDIMQFSEEFTLGKIFVKGKRVARGSKDRADYILFHNRDLPIRANIAELVGASEVFKPYLLLALRDPWVRAAFADQAIGTSSSMRNISQDKIRSALLGV